MSLILPDSYREDVVDGHIARANWVDDALRAFDPRLSLGWVGEKADRADLVPNRWHVQMDLRELGLGVRYIPITTPDGGFREPDAGVLMEMQRRASEEINNPDAQIRAREKREKALSYKGEQARAAAKEEVRDYVKAVDEPGVLISPDVKWTYKAKGRKA